MPKKDRVGASELWTKFYGALILFFEDNGHTDVPDDHRNPAHLRRWVCEQRGKLSELSEDEVKQLRILNFRFHGETYSPTARRCSRGPCKKFAAFNGRCHAHAAFGQQPREASEAMEGESDRITSEVGDQDNDDNGSGPKNSGLDETAVTSAGVAQQQTPEEAEWSNKYGSLILFFERQGHTDVPAGSNPDLHRWVEEQLVRFPELSEQQARQLRMLNFPTPGMHYTPSNFRLCFRGGCTKFAAFNGQCHAHYSADPTATDPNSVEARRARRKAKAERPKPPPRPDFPLIEVRKRRNKNYNIEFPKGRTERDVPRDEIVRRLKEFVHRLSRGPCVEGRERGRSNGNCSCMNFLQGKDIVVESVSHAIMDYYDLSPLHRKHYMVDRLRYANISRRGNHKKGGLQRIFALPLSYECFERYHPPRQENQKAEVEEEQEVYFSLDYIGRQKLIDEAFKHRICSPSFHCLHNIGQETCQALGEYASGDLSAGRHESDGKRRDDTHRFVEVYESLRDTLKALRDEYGEDGNDEVILPIQTSRRITYERWCHTRGWDIEKAKASVGRYTEPQLWGPLKGYYKSEEEALLGDGDLRKVAKKVCSWSMFCRFWNSEFPRLKTQDMMRKGAAGGNCGIEKENHAVSGEMTVAKRNYVAEGGMCENEKSAAEEERCGKRKYVTEEEIGTEIHSSAFA